MRTALLALVLSAAATGSAPARAQSLSVFDLNPGPDGGVPEAFTLFDGRLYFVASDETNGRELWRTDGTTEGTGLVVDLNPGDGNAFPSTLSGLPFELAAFEGELFFVADDGTTGPELWATDGTAGGTRLVKDVRPGSGGGQIQGLTVADGLLYFVADDGSTGRELWRTDGTTEGTALLRDVNPGSANGYLLGAPDLVAFDGALYFEADDAHGRELWRTDGTSAGTEIVQDLNPGAADSGPFGLTVFDGALYFTADDGAVGSELRRLAAGASGIELVADIRPGSDSGFPNAFAELDGALYFTANDGVVGSEPWTSDGTEGGTRLVKDIAPGSSASVAFTSFVELGGRLYFEANDRTRGWELWTTDGTEGGTRLVRDIAEGSRSALDFATFVAFDGALYFRASDGETGLELWRSDGTEAGTALVEDLWDGTADGLPASSRPSDLTVFDGALYFAADGGDGKGRELWKLGGAPIPRETAPSATVALSVAPNPGAGPIRVRLTSSAAQPVTVTLHDALGRLVATLFGGRVGPAGAVTAPLPDGLRAGLYVVRAETRGGLVSRPVVVVR